MFSQDMGIFIGMEKLKKEPGLYRIVLVLIVALILRLWGIQDQSLTMDELVDIQIAKSSIERIITTGDGFPPLYHLMLKGWIGIIPGDEASRWLSVIFGFIAVLVVWRIAQFFRDDRTTFWMVFLFSISPLHIWYSQESRAYALYFLTATFSFWFFFRALETNRLADWIWYGIAALCGLYTHYFFSILILVNAIIIIIEKRTWGELKNPLLSHIGIGLLSTGVVWLLKNDLEVQVAFLDKRSFDIMALGYTFWSFLVGFAIGPSARELHVISTTEAISQSILWIILVGGSASVLAYWGLQVLKKDCLWMRRIVILLFSVPLCGLLTNIFEVGFKVQYIIWGSIPFLFLLGRGIYTGGRQRTRWCFFSILCLVLAVSLVNRHYVDRYKNEDMRAAGAYIKSQSKEIIPVLVSPAYMAPPAAHYLGDEWPVLRITDVGKLGNQAQHYVEQIINLTEGIPNFWFIYTREFHGDPTGLLKKTLLDKGMIRLESKFPGVELYFGKWVNF